MHKYVHTEDCYINNDRIPESEKLSLNDIINDIIHDSDDIICNSCNFDSNLTHQFPIDENHPKFNIDEKALSLISDFKFKLSEFLDENYKLDELDKERDANSYINKQVGPMLDVTTKETTRLIRSIINKSPLINKIEDVFFKDIVKIREDVINFRTKLKDYKFDNLNYYTSNLNLLEYYLTNYIMFYLLHFILVGTFPDYTCVNHSVNETECCHKEHDFPDIEI